MDTQKTEKQKTENPKTENNNTGKKKTTGRQIAAIVCIVLLVLMYLVSLLAAIFDSSQSMMLFRASIIATFAVPLLTWIYIWLYGKITQKHTIADAEPPTESGKHVDPESSTHN